MNESPFEKLLAFLEGLGRAHLHYTLGYHRERALMVTVSVPGERVEVEFLADGTVEIERFISNGEICGDDWLGDLLARYQEPVG